MEHRTAAEKLGRLREREKGWEELDGSKGTWSQLSAGDRFVRWLCPPPSLSHSLVEDVHSDTIFASTVQSTSFSPASSFEEPSLPLTSAQILHLLPLVVRPLSRSSLYPLLRVRNRRILSAERVRIERRRKARSFLRRPTPRGSSISASGLSSISVDFCSALHIS
jgi:hypothetical protein